VTHIKLHTFKQPASAQTACSLSPFCEKLELFLRMAALDFKAIDGKYAHNFFVIFLEMMKISLKSYLRAAVWSPRPRVSCL
jgi:hypothetical protein